MIYQSASTAARIRAVVLIAAACLLAACAPIPPARSAGQTAPTATASPVATQPAAAIQPTPAGADAELKNGTYELPDFGSFQLKDGKFEQKTGAGATEIKTAGLEESASGDLNGDGRQDAVVELWTNTGGTGVFHYLVALLNQDGALRQAASSLLGDRVQLKRLAIDPAGKVVVDFTGFKASDPLCCPSQPVTRTYQLEGGALKMLSETAP